MAKSNEPSALYKTLKAASEGAASPSTAAKAAGGYLAPPGAGEAVAQGLQMGANAALVFSKEFMEGVVRQHGESPATKLNNMQIKQAIASQAQANKGIEAARQKAVAKPTGEGAGQSANKGIDSYQSKVSGQTAGSSKSSASSGKSNGGQGNQR